MTDRRAGSYLDDDCIEPNYDNEGMRAAEMPAVTQESLCGGCIALPAEQMAVNIFETIQYG